jgi:hypothetical protein
MRPRARACLAGAALAAAASVWLVARTCSTPPAPSVSIEGAPRDDGAAGAADAETPADAAADAPDPLARTARAPLAPEPAAPTFDELLAAMVRLVLAGHDAVTGGDDARAAALQREADSVWVRIHQSVANPEERALFVYAETAAAGSPVAHTLEEQVRRRVCVRLIAEGLERRYRAARASGDRGPIDRLVAALLTELHRDEPTARDLGELLVDRPYLGLRHEAAVLELVAAVTERPYLSELASALLRTLWRNLESTGARSTDELAGLALLFKDDANPSRRLAALQQLLVARDGRYRELVLQDILREQNTALAREAAMAAALELEPAAALAVLERLAPLGRQQLMAAFMTVGARDAALLQEAYRQQLAQNTDPGLRAELVSGIGFERSRAAIELARLAFEQDPDVEVRTRALLALSARGGAALGEQVLMAALDDPRFDEPVRLSALVSALGNLAAQGDVNAVDRVGHRLLARAKLLSQDRERLEELLRRVLPAK